MPLDSALLFDAYGPQLGELAWHSITADSKLMDMSEHHAQAILSARRFVEGRETRDGPRILELGAYAHCGAHIAAVRMNGLSVAHDISPSTLRIGRSMMPASARTTLVAGDFHDLPFATGYFDIVFSASSIHHTRRPKRLLREAMRVLRPGGVLHLHNEPVARALCFYRFRGNRLGEFTPVEQAMYDRGLLWTFASPFPGSRMETLFGMIENDLIPLDTYLDALSEDGEIVDAHLVSQVYDFEKELLDLPVDPSLDESIADVLLKARSELRSLVRDKDALLGISLPSDDDIWRLAYTVEPLIRSLSGLDEEARQRQIARIFGSSLRVTARKAYRDEPRPTTMFTRELRETDGVFDDLPRIPGVSLILNEEHLPDLQTTPADVIPSTYPSEDWLVDSSSGLVSLCNLKTESQILVPGLPDRAVVMARLYTVGAPEPYQVYLRDNHGNELNRITVVQSESVLLRQVIEPDTTQLVLGTSTLKGEQVHMPLYVRPATVRLIRISEGRA